MQPRVPLVHHQPAGSFDSTIAVTSLAARRSTLVMSFLGAVHPPSFPMIRKDANLVVATLPRRTWGDLLKRDGPRSCRGVRGETAAD